MTTLATFAIVVLKGLLFLFLLALIVTVPILLMIRNKKPIEETNLLDEPKML